MIPINIYKDHNVWQPQGCCRGGADPKYLVRWTTMHLHSLKICPYIRYIVSVKPNLMAFYTYAHPPTGVLETLVFPVVRPWLHAYILLAQHLINRLKEFHQTLVVDGFELPDKLIRFEGQGVKVKVTKIKHLSCCSKCKHSHRCLDVKVSSSIYQKWRHILFLDYVSIGVSLK